MKNQVTFFPVGNGDTTLIEAGGMVVLTDIHYRSECMDEDTELYDFGPDLRQACRRKDGSHAADVFVLTHPDKDHLGGADTLLHLGPPEDYVSDPEEGEPKILLTEIWVSPYAVDPAYETEQSKAMIEEVRRRDALRDTPEGEEDGNRLKVLTSDGGETEGWVGSSLHWKLLAPTEDEADIEQPDDEDEDNKASANNSSLVVLWRVEADEGEAYFMIAGDAEVEVWERIKADYAGKLDELAWHVLLAPHHVSRGVLNRKNLETEEYEASADARTALSQIHGDGFIVASSKEIKDDDDNPPSYEAKQEYLDILKKKKTSNHEDRFLNPDTHKDGEPAPVVFEVTKNGPKCRVAEKVSKSAAALGLGAASPGSYGAK